MTQSCFICDRINLIKTGENRYFVKELETGNIVFCDYQFYKGYTIFISKIHTHEPHLLDSKLRDLFLHEMALVGEAVYKTFNPQKLNYELLGNSDSHLHFHLIPRHKDDINPKTAIWVIEKSIRCSIETVPTDSELREMKRRLIREASQSKVK